MSQPDNHNDSARLPGYRRHRGWERGQGQASSDPTPAPQTALSRNQDQSSYVQKGGLGKADVTPNASRQSDPFYYDSQSIPYWDDSTGVIHNIPSSPSRHPGKSKVKSIADWYNPYAEIVGGGPYAQVSGADHGASIVKDRLHAHKTSPEMQMASEIDPSAKQSTIEEGKESTSKSLLDSIHAQGDRIVEISKKDRLRWALGRRNTRQGATAMIKAATEKRGVGNKGDLEPSTSLDMTEIPGKKDGNLKGRKNSWAFGDGPSTSGSMKILKVENSFRASHTRAIFEGHKLPVAETPMPLEALEKKQEAGRVIERTPTLDRVRRLRAEEHAKALAILEGRPIEVGTDHKDNLQLAGRLAQHVIKPDMTRVGNNALSDEEHQGTTSSAGASLQNTNSASSSMYSTDEGDDIEKLAKAVAGLRPFQNLPSPSKLGSFQRHSAIPDGLDLGRILKAKEQVQETEPSVQERVSHNRTAAEAEAELADALSAVATSADRAGAANSSGDSLVTLSSEDYDRLGGKEKLKMEQNGVKRRWYKGFRKA